MKYWFLKILFILIALLSWPKISSATITNPCRNDGFGAQFYTIILSAMYGELANDPFLYTPFSKMEHNYDNDPDFLNKKEDLINFKNHFPLLKNRFLQNRFSVDIYELANFFTKNMDACLKTSVFQKIQRIFKENKNKKDYLEEKYLNVAIHIRRPNQDDQPPFGKWYPSNLNAINDTYLTVINLIRQEYAQFNQVKECGLLFHIYSQGNIEDFSSIFKGPDIVFHLNESIETTFSSMVYADCLINFPNSALSYTAGLLSDGKVYYFTSLDMPPLPHWTLLKRDW